MDFGIIGSVKLEGAEITEKQSKQLRQNIKNLAAAVEGLSAGQLKMAKSALALHGAMERNRKTTFQASKEQERYKKAVQDTAAAEARKQSAVERSTRAQQKHTAQTKNLASATGNAVSATALFRTALIGLTAAFSVQRMIEYTDVINKMRAATSLYTDSAEDAIRVQDELINVARRSRGSLEGTISLYQKLSLATRNLGYTNGQVTQMVENLQKAIRVSGSTFREAAAAAQQFAQGVASGNLQGDELRSIRENAPYVAAVLEDFYAKINGIRVPLKQLGEEGKLVPEFIAAAFQDAGERIEKDFAGLPISMADAFNRFSTEFSALILDIDRGSGVINAMAKSVYFVAKNLDLVISSVALLAGSRGLIALVAGLTAATRALYGAATGAIAFNEALKVNPLIRLGSVVLTGISLGVLAIGGAFNTVSKETQIANESITKTEQLIGFLNESNKKLIANTRELTEEEKNLREEKRRQAQIEMTTLDFQIEVHESKMRLLQAEIEKIKERNEAYNFRSDGFFGEGVLGGARDALSIVTFGMVSKSPKILKDLVDDKDYNEAKSKLTSTEAFVERLRKKLEELKLVYSGGILPSSGGTGGIDEAAEKLFEYQQELARSVEESERLLEASKKGIEVYEQEKLLIEAQNEVLKQKIDLNSQLGQQTLADIQLKQRNNELAKENIGRFREEEREAKRRAREIERLMNEPYRRAAENIQDTFSDMFQSVFREGIDGFSDFADRVKDIMLTMVAEIAAAMVFRPILGDVIGGAMGGGQGAAGVGGGLVDSLGSLSDLSNLTNLSSLTKPIFSQGGTMGKAINSVGDFFGVTGTLSTPAPLEVFGPNLPGASPQFLESFGPPAPGGMNSLINPANILASFAGSQLSDMFGLSGKYSGIGSTLGSIGGSVAGSAIGSSMGTILGMAGGPAGMIIGTLLGSFGGSALGGLFGGKPSDKGQWAVSDFAGSVVQEGGLEGKKFSQENRDIAKQFSSLGGTIARMVSDFEGVEQSFNQVQVKIGNRDGSFAALMQDGEVVGDRLQSGSSGAELLKTIVDGILNNTTGLPAYIENAMRKVNFGEDFDKALSDIQFILNFDNMVDGFGVVEEEMTQTEQTMKQLEEAIKNARIEVKRLELPMDKFNEGIERAYETMRNQINEGLTNELIGGQSDYYTAYIAEVERHENAMKDAEATGASLNIVMAIHNQNLEKLNLQYSNQIESMNEQINIMQDFTETAERLGEVLYNIMVGPTSILGPLEQLDMARAEFQDLYNTALGGGEAGMEAAESLGAVGEQLIDLSKSYFGSSDEVAADFNNVIDSIKTVQDFYAGQGAGVQDLINERDDLTNEVTSFPNAANLVQSQMSNIQQLGLTSEVEQILKNVTQGMPSGMSQADFLANNMNLNAAAYQALEALGIPGFGSNTMQTATPSIQPKQPVSASQFDADFYAQQRPDVVAFMNANPDVLPSLYQHYLDFGFDEGTLPFQGYANGGFAPAGRPFMVGENGPELLSFGRPAYITPNVPANDNSSIMAGFMSMIQAQQAQTAVMREGFNQLIAEQRRAAEAAEETSKSQKRRSAA